MTKVAVNKTTAEFALSRKAYNMLLQQKGWRFIGTIDMNRELTPLSSVIDANDDPIIPVITTTASAGGSIARRGGNTPALKIGDNVTYDFTPTSGKYVKSVIVDGDDGGAGITSYTFTGLNDNHNLEVVFDTIPTLAADEYYVTVFSTDGGNTAFQGTNVVADEGSLIVTAKPYTGYTFDAIILDGVAQDISALTPSSTYTMTFDTLVANHSIAVFFRSTSTLDIPVVRSTKLLWNDLYSNWYMNVTDRSDADMISVIETLQASGLTNADGEGCKIRIITVPNEITAWEVKRNCDNLEIVTTPYQKWE